MTRLGRHKIQRLAALDQYPIASLSPRLRRINLPYLGAVSIGFTAIPLSQVRRDICPCVDMRVSLSEATQTGAIVRFLVPPGPPGLGGEMVQSPTLKKIMGCPSPRSLEPDQPGESVRSPDANEAPGLLKEKEDTDSTQSQLYEASLIAFVSL